MEIDSADLIISRPALSWLASGPDFSPAFHEDRRDVIDDRRTNQGRRSLSLSLRTHSCRKKLKLFARITRYWVKVALSIQFCFFA